MANTKLKPIIRLILLMTAFGALAILQDRCFRQPYRKISPDDTLRGDWVRQSHRPVILRQDHVNGIHSPLIIQQIGQANPAGPLTADGKPADWIELMNRSETPIELRNYSLNDATGLKKRWLLPDLVLPPGKRLLIWADDQSGIFSDLTCKYPYRRRPPNWTVRTDSASPAGILLYGQAPSNAVAQEPLVYVLHIPEEDRYDLWLIHRPEGKAGLCRVDIRIDGQQAAVAPEHASRHFVSSRVCNPETPDGSWMASAGAHRVDVLLLEGATALDRIVVTRRNETFGVGFQDIHAPFKLNREGEILSLHSPRGLLLDHTRFPELEPGQSWQRIPEGQGFFISAPPHPLGMDLTAPPQVEPADGYVEAGRRVTMIPGDPRDELRYTTNGALPTADSSRYTQPLVLSNSIMLCVRAFRNGALPGAVVRRLYETGSRSSIPLLWCVMRPEDIDGMASGLLRNPQARGPAGERLAHACLMFPDGSSQACDTGFRMQGRSTRQMKVKKSFRLKCRDRYGQAAWPGPVYADTGSERQRSLVLMGHSIVKHPLGLEVMETTGIPSPRTRHIRLRINDSIMGLYMLMEDPNDPEFLKRLYGHLDLDVLKIKTFNPVKYGDEEAYGQTWGALGQPDETLTLDWLRGVMDPAAFVRWVAGVQFLGFADNQQGYLIHDRQKSPPAWSLINWDLDGSMELSLTNATRLPDVLGARGVAHEALLHDPAYITLYRREFEKLLDTAFQSAPWLKRLSEYQAIILGNLDWERQGLRTQDVPGLHDKTTDELTAIYKTVFDDLARFFLTQPDAARRILEFSPISDNP